MLNLRQFLLSKTIWVLAATFIFNGIQAVHPILDPTTANTLNILLTGAAGVARVANSTGGPAPTK